MKKLRWWQGLIAFVIIMLVIAGAVLSIKYDIEKNNNAVTMVAGLWSAIATASLGGIALWQNKRYKKLSDDMSDLANMPELYQLKDNHPDKIDFEAEDSFSEKYALHVFPSNISDSTVIPLYLSNLALPVVCLDVGYLQVGKKSYSIFNEHTPLSLFAPRTQFVIDIFLPHDTVFQNTPCSLSLSYENIYGTKYEKQIKFIVTKTVADDSEGSESISASNWQCLRAERCE